MDTCDSQISQTPRVDSFHELLQHVAAEHDRIVQVLQQNLVGIIEQSELKAQVRIATDSSRQNPPSPIGLISSSREGATLMCQRSSDDAENGTGDPASEPRELARRVQNYLQHKEERVRRTLESGRLIQNLQEIKGWRRPEVRGNSFEAMPFCPRVAAIATHGCFDYFCASVTILNLAFLGVITDLNAQRKSQVLRGRSKHINFLFSLFFLIELLTRILAFGPSQFFLHSRFRLWNNIDASVMFMDAAEIVISWLWLEHFGGSLSRGAPLLRIVRLLRVARAARIPRLVRYLTQLRLMILIIFKSLGAIFWSGVVFGMTTYLFSVVLVFSVTIYRFDASREKDPQEDALLQKRFGTTGDTMLTLFYSVYGGLDWAVYGDMLFKIGWGSGMIMCAYVFFTVFAMMNIITGIFVDYASECVYNDREELTRKEMHTEKSTFSKLKKIFAKADSDQSGTMSFDEFQALIQNEKTVALLKRLGLEVHAARGLFKLLDHENKGSVDSVEFLVSCMRILGGAKQVDLATLMYENKKLMTTMLSLFSYIKAEFKVVEDRLSAQIVEERYSNQIVLQRLGLSGEGQASTNPQLDLKSPGRTHHM